MEMLQLFAGGTDQHVAHEEGVVGARAHNADADAVLLVPAGVSIDNVDAIPRVQVVDSTLAVDFPDLLWSAVSLGLDR